MNLTVNKRKKAREKCREEILISLPEFLNQLLLLMNSGRVLTEAVMTVADGMRRLPESEKNSFTRGVTEACDRAEQTGEDVIVEFYRFARLSNDRDLSSVAGILMDSRSRGTDLWDKLFEQSERLWNERKMMAEEKIRIAETKMSFPLGIMLIALIIITAAPALMNI